MNRVFVPPIKCQGIKTKLVSKIRQFSSFVDFERWVEPFFGSGVVCFNVLPKNALLADINPHLVNFYKKLQNGEITPSIVKKYLEQEGSILEQTEGKYYYEVRERFNLLKNPMDFLFLNRSCFNGMIRFNAKGQFNVPFCNKPRRFAQAYVTKIVNQVAAIQEIIINNNYTFVCQSFQDTIRNTKVGDLLYCDPPYIGRHVDYFESWNEHNEIELHDLLTNSHCPFIVSTWHSNQYRNNPYIASVWADLFIHIREHFYHVGGNLTNRNPMLEAILTNFDVMCSETPALVEEETLFS